MKNSTFIKTLQVLFFALLFSQVVLMAVVYTLIQQKSISPNPNEVFAYILPIAALALIAQAFMLFSKKLNDARAQQGLTNKLTAYRTAFILQCALLEAPSIMGSVFALVTGDKWFLLAPAAIAGIFLTRLPTKKRLIEELELDYKEQTENMKI